MILQIIDTTKSNQIFIEIKPKYEPLVKSISSGNIHDEGEDMDTMYKLLGETKGPIVTAELGTEIFAYRSIRLEDVHPLWWD